MNRKLLAMAVAPICASALWSGETLLASRAVADETGVAISGNATPESSGIYKWEPNADQPSTSDVPAAPEDGGPRHWEVTGVSSALNLRKQPSTSADIVTRFAPGTALDNHGCTRINDELWCDVQELGGGPRGYVSAEFLTPAVSPDGSIATGIDDSALRAGQGHFDATGHIFCSRSAGQPIVRFEFGVARSGGGDATVVIYRPNDRNHAIYFRMGKPVGTDTGQTDGYPEFSATKEGDLHLIRIGDDRYEIPEAVVFGGQSGVGVHSSGS